MTFFLYSVFLFHHQVLFLLVGYDELSEEESGDITELIEGQMFANATVVLTSRPGSSKTLPSVLHRRLLIAGLAPDQTHRFISRYFEAIKKPASGNEVSSPSDAVPTHSVVSLVAFSTILRCETLCWGS